MTFTEDDIYLIFLNTRPQIQKFVNRRIRCQDTTADLLQDLYLRLSLLTPTPRSETEIRAWLFTVASNLSIDYLRSQKRHSELLVQYAGNQTEADHREEPERVTQAQDQLWQIQAALAELPEACADMLYLSRIEGLSHAEIAAQLGISTSWVEKQLARALNHCRQSLDYQP
ncbi:MAG: RNA polymerase sigma factor [Methylovulum sp.]|nr:RNA polymerase sigma factor [Methylovulum sp.]